ncbi:MAG: methyltransferase [Hyphomicrobiales bacterium]|nr:MAG: methyltransferase [Hyphomicrobiales bacterium]
MRVGDGLAAGNANWTFGGDVAKQFDDHVAKSVPLYNEGHGLSCAVSDFFVKPDSTVYEIGCSTGVLTCKLSEHNKSKSGAKFIGIDVEDNMISQANEKRKKLGLDNVTFEVGNALLYEYEPADLIVAYYTVQFIRPSQRQQLFDLLYNSLQWGGALVLFEKVRGPDARFQDMLTSLYSDYKLDQGYDAEEIVSKTRSLKGVLEPFSTQGNIDLMKRAGFKDIMSIMKYLCFEGFVAIK